jgi:hypothetical protein
MTIIQSKNVKSIIENQLFKTRYIFALTANNKNILNVNCEIPSISFEKVTKNNFLDLKSIYSEEYPHNYFNSMEKRLENPEIWKGFLIRSDNIPIGSFWWLIPNEKKEYYDNFWVDTKSILFCSGYVHSRYRGKHIFNMMHFYSFNLLKADFPTRTLLMIVEKRNISSIKSMMRSNLMIFGNNYLFKIFGKNLISIYNPKKGSICIWLMR